ncbi:MAG: sugar ABC transporter ATP-binding protein [Paracoccaceae bacterium]
MVGEEPLNRFGLFSRAMARGRGTSADRRIRFRSRPRRAGDLADAGKQQMVEICKALRQRPRLLILDEPTASLSEHDSQILLDLVRRLKAQGTAIIYVTHRMHEIPAIGDCVTVLRDGQLIDTVPADTPEDDLIRLMTGRQMSKVYPEPRVDLGDVRLRIDNITTARQSGHVQVKGASLTVRAGEIVGIAGLVGCGKSELAQAAFGLHFLEEGNITVDGRTGRASHPSVAIRNKVWYLPSDRRLDGLSMMRSARENMALSSYSFGPLEGAWVKRNRETRILEELARHVDFDIGKLDDPVSSLSGGNQQKVLLAKAMVQDISVYVLDEPTVGVDIGACLSIYRALAELSALGAAILIVSSNLPELMGLTHRLMVMSDGRFVAEFQRDEYDEHRILEQFF